MLFDLENLVLNYLNGEVDSESALERALTGLETTKYRSQSVKTTKTSLLFTDIVNSSATYEDFGDEYGRAILSIHDNIVHSTILKRGGTVIKGTGDGSLATFESCGKSVKAALLILKQIEAHNHNYPLLPIQLRIGINIGSIIQDETDIHGTSVNLAARLTELADPGTILTTGIVHSRCKEKGYQFIDLGLKAFKGFRKKIPVYQIVG